MAAPTVAAASAPMNVHGWPVSGSTTVGSAADWAIFQPAIGTMISDGRIGMNVSRAMPIATPTYPTASYS